MIPTAPTPFLDAAFKDFGPPPRPPDALKPSPFSLRHVDTFQALLTTAAKTYWDYFDEALRQDPATARAMRRDGYLIALLRERQRPVGRAAWHVQAEDDKDPRQLDAAKLVTAVIDRIPRFARLRMKLRECDWFGKYAVQTVVRRQLVNGRMVKGPVNWLPIHGDKIVIRHDGTPGFMINGLTRETYETAGYLVLPVLRGYAAFAVSRRLREQFIIDTFEIDDADFYEQELAGGIAGLGLRHHVQWLWFLRTEVISMLLDYLRRVGAGGLTVVTYEDGDRASLEAAKRVGADLESGNVVYVPRPKGTAKEAVGIERIEPSEGGAQVLITIASQWFESKIERLFIGQSASASSETSGMGTHDNAFQMDTKFQLILGDAEDLDETLTTDLVGPLVRWNCPGADFRLRFVTDLAAPDNDKKLDTIKKFVDMGGTVPTADVRKLTGLPAPQDGDEVLGGTAGLLGGMPGPGGSGAAGGQQQGGDPGPGGGPVGPSPQGEAAPADQGQVPPMGDTEGGGEGETDSPDDDQSSPDIQAYFQQAVESGRLFTPAGLSQMREELAAGGWRYNLKSGLQHFGPAPFGLQYAKAQWAPYTNPETGRAGWKSAGGRVVYEDPTRAPEEHPQGRKPAEQDPSQPKPARAPDPGEKVRRHVGVPKGRAGGLEAITAHLGGMLDDPEAVTPKGMAALVDSLMTLTVKELDQLRQQYGGKRGRKEGMVAGLTGRLQEEGLPAPKRTGIDAPPEVGRAAGPAKRHKPATDLDASSPNSPATPDVSDPVDWARAQFGAGAVTELAPGESVPRPKPAPVPPPSREAAVASRLAAIRKRFAEMAEHPHQGGNSAERAALEREREGLTPAAPAAQPARSPAERRSRLLELTRKSQAQRAGVAKAPPRLTPAAPKPASPFARAAAQVPVPAAPKGMTDRQRHYYERIMAGERPKAIAASLKVSRQAVSDAMKNAQKRTGGEPALEQLRKQAAQTALGRLESQSQEGVAGIERTAPAERSGAYDPATGKLRPRAKHAEEHKRMERAETEIDTIIKRLEAGGGTDVAGASPGVWDRLAHLFEIASGRD